MINSTSSISLFEISVRDANDNVIGESSGQGFQIQDNLLLGSASCRTTADAKSVVTANVVAYVSRHLRIASPRD